MRDQRTAASDLQVLDNVLRDTSASTLTRRRLLQGAAAGAAAAGALAAPAAAGGRGESPREILSTLATAESFGVTFLTEAVRRAPGTRPRGWSTRCGRRTRPSTTTSSRCASSAGGNSRCGSGSRRPRSAAAASACSSRSRPPTRSS